MDNRELENDELEALYPETEILENVNFWKVQKCSKCDETFSDKESKQKHMQDLHGGPFVCTICGRPFSHRSGLAHHLPMHSDIKAFLCNICGKAFRQRSGLAHHKQTHSLVKSFKCNICGKSFAQGSGLIHHKSTHSSTKNFTCDVCGKRFAQRSGLAHHKSIHMKKNKTDIDDSYEVLIA